MRMGFGGVARLALVLAVMALLASACGVGDGDGAAANSAEIPTGTGTVVIGENSFAFEATTCLVDDGHVVVEGPGVTEDEQAFFVTVDSSGIVDVAFDVGSRVDVPAQDKPWWRALEGAVLETSGQTVNGTATFVDAHSDTDDEHAGTFDVTCGPV